MKNCHSRIYGAEFSREEINDAVKNGRLLSMEIEFNRSCNFRCVYCYAGGNGGRESELSRDELRDVIIQARELGARKIIVLGGEPMLYPHLMEMLAFIRERGMEVELFTNGTRMTLSAAKELCGLGVRVVLKMNTFDESLQDMLSGKKGAHKQIHEAFKNLNDAGYPSKCSMGISTIICRQNIDELVNMWQWLRDQNIAPYFEMITPQGEASENDYLYVEPQRMKEFFYRISEIDREKYGYEWEPKPPLVGGECLRHQFSCAVSSEGFVQPCVGVTIPIGNVRQQRLKDILRDSEVIQDLKNFMNTIKGPCSSCEKIEECYGCRGAAYQLTGDYLASDPMCWKNADRQNEIVRLPARADGLIPHRPPMLMIEKLLELTERASRSEMTVTSDTIFLRDDGTLDEASYPEIISQAIATQEGFKNLRGGVSRQEGFLLGIKSMEVLGAAKVGDRLSISVFKVAKYGDFGIIKGEIYRGKEMIARGEVKLWHTFNTR